MSNLPLNFNSPDELKNNINYLNILLGGGNVSNFDNLLNNKIHSNNINSNVSINSPNNYSSANNLNFPFNNNLNFSHILSNPINNLAFQNTNQISNSEPETKIDSKNNYIPLVPKGSINVHVNFHFNLNLINTKNPISQNSHSELQMTKTEDVRRNSRENSLSDKSNKIKEELNGVIFLENKDNLGILDNIYDNQNYLTEIEKTCNKYNNKIIENVDQENNNTNLNINVANFNSVLTKNIVNPDPKINDYIYYLNLLNNPEMNNNLLYFIKNNFDLNKIGEEYKNLIFNDNNFGVFSNDNKKTTNLNGNNNQNINQNNLSTNISNNSNSVTNLPLNQISNINNLSSILSSISNSNPLNNLNNQLNNPSNFLNDQITLSLLQNPIYLQQIQVLLSNPELQKSDTFGFLNSLYGLSNLNSMNPINNDNKLPRNNIYNNDNNNINEIKNNPIFILGNSDRDLINDLNNINNFGRVKNNNYAPLQNNFNNNQNKDNIFLSNKIKRKSSPSTDSALNKNCKSYDYNYNNMNNNNYEDMNEDNENINYKNISGFAHLSHEGKHQSNNSRNNDDIYDFMKSKKFHIKKFSKHDQQPLTNNIINNNNNFNINANNTNNNSNNAINGHNLSVSNVNNAGGSSVASNNPSQSGNLININMSNLSLPEKTNKENRKFKADSIHKKIKVNVLKYLKGTICEFIPNKRINNLSQEIITNVNISFNKELLEKALYKIYEDDYLENDGLETLDNIKRGMCENREFFELMNLTLKDFIIYKYWKSDFHKKKLSKIFQQESYEYYVNYEYLDREFINYFLNNKGNKRKILKNKKGTSVDEKSEYSLTASINA